jgi:hypothetical protein
MKERPAGTFPHSLSLLFGTRASDTSHSLLRARTMSSNNTTIEETERLLHPETRALLSSIHTTASQYRERTTTTTTKSHTKFLTTPRNVVLGGIGVATVALGSYVSGYRSSSIAGLRDATTTTMRLGNEQQQQQQQQQQHSKKVVLHTGCSPVAQVEKTRWLFFLYRIVALQFRGPSLDWMMMMIMIIIFVLCKQQQQQQQQQQQRVRRFGNGRKKQLHSSSSSSSFGRNDE